MRETCNVTSLAFCATHAAGKQITLAHGSRTPRSRTLSTNAACQLYVFGLDGYAPGVNGAQIAVFKQPRQVRLRSLLQGHQCHAVKAQVGLDLLPNLSNQALKGQFTKEQLCGPLVAAYLSQGHGPRTVAVGLLRGDDGRGPGCTHCLPGHLPHACLPGRLAAGNLAYCLLGRGHLSAFSGNHQAR